jgi:branched-chain amino acid transport system ATP-binding protein
MTAAGPGPSLTPASGQQPSALEVTELSLRFGAVAALDQVSFAVRAGELFAVIGPNGAGKTTLFNLLSCIYPPSSGTVRCFGTDLAQRKPHQLAHLGIARTFQNLGLFPMMSVIDNVLVGRTHLMRRGTLSAGLSLPWSRREERLHRQAAREALEFAGLADIADTPVGVLPYGTRKKVELARAISMQPRLLLLDEPVAGMSKTERADVVTLVRAIRQRYDLTIVLVEHDMTTVMALAERILVLDFGRIIALGAPAEIQANPDVINAYLGKPEGLLAELSKGADGSPEDLPR